MDRDQSPEARQANACKEAHPSSFENEDFQIALTKAEQLQDLLQLMFVSRSLGSSATPLQDLSMDLAMDVLYAIRRLK